MQPERLHAALAKTPGVDWLREALAEAATDPERVARLFATAGRHCGRSPLPDAPGWSADEAARALLLRTLADVTPDPDKLALRVEEFYRYGDAAEKRAVLKALPLLSLGQRARPLLHDAIRTNDARLVAAALGPCADDLDQAMWRQGVLKCVFMGVALSVVDRLTERADAELATMLAGLVEERRAAGRDVAADALDLLARLEEA